MRLPVSVNEVRKLSSTGALEQASSTQRAYLSHVLGGLQAMDTHHGATVAAVLEDALGIERMLDILYLAGVYGVNTEILIGDPNEYIEMHKSERDIVRAEFEAAGYLPLEKDLVLPIVAAYVGSSPNRGRMLGVELSKNMIMVQSPTSYLQGMRSIYERSFGDFQTVDGAEKREGGHLLGYQYPEALARRLEEFSVEVSSLATQAGIKYVPYDTSTIHTTIGVIRRGMDDKAWKEEEGIGLDEHDDVLNTAPTFRNGGIGASKDTIILKTTPIGVGHLGITKSKVLSTPEMGGAWGTHITLGRFVGTPGDPAVVEQIREIMERYTNILQKEFAFIVPEAIFTGTFDLDTPNTPTPTFELIKKKTYRFLDANTQA